MCRFNIDYEGHPSAILEEAKKMIEGDGGALVTSDTHAWFTVHTPVGRVDGTCELTDSPFIAVTITKKPFNLTAFLTCTNPDARNADVPKCTANHGSCG